MAQDALTRALCAHHDDLDAQQIAGIALRLVVNWDDWLRYCDSRSDITDS
jgi:hypothetical protein